MKLSKIFTIGSATFDIFTKAHNSTVLHFDRPEGKESWLGIPYGGKLKVDEVHETFGGGSTNTAVGFSRMGFPTACVTKVGTPYGDQVTDNLRREGVDVRYVSQARREKTGFSIILNSFEGERTVLYHPGANAFFSHKDLPQEALSEADWIFLNHVSAEKTGIHHAMIQLLQKYPLIKACWNPGHEQIKEGARHWHSLLKRLHILFLNKEEAAEFSRKSFYHNTLKVETSNRHLHLGKKRHFLAPEADDLSEIFKALFRFGAKIVVITDGRNGAQACDGKNIYHCPIINEKRVDTLGAGDAFSIGFTSAILLGKSLKEALIYGTLNASSVIQYFGAQRGLLTRAKLLSHIRKIQIKITEDPL
ncbi:carbohydrate kinase family protein [Candidatus Peregrinibacteria bacterium]|nr:carbohydrate kinase family protein [Candidatus Peregrinibacteria bacterium]